MERNLFAVINNIRLSKEGQSILKRMGNIGLPVCHVDNDEWLFIVPGSRSCNSKCMTIVFRSNCIKVHYFEINQNQDIIIDIANKLSKEKYSHSGNFLPTAFFKHTFGENLTIGIQSRKRAVVLINDIVINQLQLAV